MGGQEAFIQAVLNVDSRAVNPILYQNLSSCMKLHAEHELLAAGYR
jgi:hypothetical protein